MCGLCRQLFADRRHGGGGGGGLRVARQLYYVEDRLSRPMVTRSRALVDSPTGIALESTRADWRMYNGILGLSFPSEACTPTCVPTFLAQVAASQQRAAAAATATTTASSADTADTADAAEPWTDVMGLCLGESGGRLALGGVETKYIDEFGGEVFWTPMRSNGAHATLASSRRLHCERGAEGRGDGHAHGCAFLLQ